MFGLFKKKEPVFAVAHLNMRLQPKDRHNLIEDPLDDFLNLQKLGSVAGGGTALDDEGRVVSSDVEMNLNDRDAVLQVIDELNALGAAKGSTIRIDETVTQFGANEGLALYLDMTLPDDVVAEDDIGRVFAMIDKTLEGIGRWLSSHTLNQEFVLYIYGPSFQDMKKHLMALFPSEPLFENARIEQIV